MTPSTQMVLLYRLLSRADEPILADQIQAAVGGSNSGSRHMLLNLTRIGVLKRHRGINAQYRYTWEPKSADAKATAALIIEASAFVPQMAVPAETPLAPRASPDPAAQVLRALARLLDAAAERFEKEHR